MFGVPVRLGKKAASICVRRGISKKLEMLKLVEFDDSALFYDICEYRIS